MNKQEIIDGHYDGYIWMSDESSPVVLLDAVPQITLDPQFNPFVIEAQLYNKEQGISYSIRYVDGDYIVNRYDLEDAGDYEEKSYIPARMPDVSALKFRQYWEISNDDKNYGWETLIPERLVFVGFELKEK